MENKTSNNKQNISTVKIVYLVIFLLLVGMIILYAGGTFVTPKVDNSKVVNNTKANNQVRNSADMTALNEIKSLESNVKNNPNDLTALLKLAHLLNDSGFYQKAIDNYNKYLEEESNNVDVIIDMGVCYYQLGNYDAAIKTMEKGITLNPKHQIAHFNMGIVSSAKGDHDNALKFWKKAIDINPTSNIGIKAKDLLDNH